ncbi:hypothetical protein NDU88_012029 [Pleurodeles waltl]|uniref:Prolactin receptor n=1 Tax=Pleurodeles waltl TaxID=8319 RepID=A0AAV7R529_PLEWA|nr:hypothetical protein NDU88_012029 [Pleurodeles waltl]
MLSHPLPVDSDSSRLFIQQEVESGSFKLGGNKKQWAESPFDVCAQNLQDTESQGAKREDPGGGARNQSNGTPLVEEVNMGEKTEAAKCPKADEFPALVVVESVPHPVPAEAQREGAR